MRLQYRQIIYAIFALVGLCLTWYYNLQYFAQEGTSLASFISDNKLNSASSSVWYDIVVVAFAFTIWSYFECKRIGMKRWWLYTVLTYTVACAFAFPLFLLMRERHLTLNSPGLNLDNA